MKKKLLISITFVLFIVFPTLSYASGWNVTNIWTKQESGSLTLIGGTVRQGSDGVWFVQNDENHTPLNLYDLRISGDRMRVTFQSNVKKVVSLSITPDDVLAKKGYVAAGSGVGLSGAEFQLGRIYNVYGGISYYNGRYGISYTNKNEYTISAEQRPDGIVRINHDGGFGTIPIQLTPRDGAYTPKLVTFGDRYFDIRFYDGDTPVTKCDEKCNAVFTRTGYKIVDFSNEQLPVDGNLWITGIMVVEQ